MMNRQIWKDRKIHKGNFFIGDGIIDEERWEQATTKVLFIMKEAYESSEEVLTEWNLNDYLKQKSLKELAKPMWWSMAQWLKGINYLSNTN